jgi:type II secretory pathway pseudopilin PulG
MVVVGIIGIVAAISVPSLFSYLQTMNQKAAAQELAAALARARELAITSNQFVCVETSTAAFASGPVPPVEPCAAAGRSGRGRERKSALTPWP